MNTEENLRECPFCNGIILLLKYKTCRSEFACKDCKAFFRLEHIGICESFGSTQFPLSVQEEKYSAIQSWNTRVSDHEIEMLEINLTEARKRMREHWESLEKCLELVKRVAKLKIQATQEELKTLFFNCEDTGLRLHISNIVDARDLLKEIGEQLK